MNIKVDTDNNIELFQFFDERIRIFNEIRWDKKKEPLVVTLKNEKDELLGGGTANTFGNWLLIENIWIDESLRGHGHGVDIVRHLENEAIERGCKLSLLDTLEFQAKPFYEKLGYKTVWVMKNYPTSGARYYMQKTLGE